MPTHWWKLARSAAYEAKEPVIRFEQQQELLVYNYLFIDICVKAKHDTHKLFDAIQGPVTKL